MAMPKKYDYAQICSERGLMYLYEDNPYVFFKDSVGFVHRMGRGRFQQGSVPSIKSVQGCKTEYFKYVFNCKHENVSKNFCFGEFVYNGVLVDSEVICLKHGKYKTKPNWLLTASHHCIDCANEENSRSKMHSKEMFLDRAYSAHKERYEYMFKDYHGGSSKVLIRCKDHGEFEQTAREHLAGNGCPDCGRIIGGYGASDYEKLCPEGSKVYLMLLQDESEMFYKIGISKEVHNRIRRLEKLSGYKVKLLSEMYHEDARKIWHLENDLHNLFHYFKYKPKVDFKGKTECFSYICREEFIQLCREYLQ